MAYKVFTNGSVLQASEINDNLMRQSVMVFSNAAARTAAITSPLEGMLTWLEDVNRYESYNGTAWVSPFGTTLLVNTDFTGVASVAVDNVFTSQYENYKIILRADTNTASSNRSVNFQFRKAASTITAANYNFGIFYVNFADTATGQFNRGLGVSQTEILQYSAAGTSSYASLDVYSPQVSTRHTSYTLINQSNYVGASAKIAIFGGGSYSANDNFDGFLLGSGGGNFTGNVKVYGYRS